jgi:regulator of replication initiation timing
MDGVGQLPVFDHIPDAVYDRTEVPESIEAAREQIVVLKAEVTDLQMRLSNGVKDLRNSNLRKLFDGDAAAFYEWRSKATDEFRLKQRQIFLLKAWIKENSSKAFGKECTAINLAAQERNKRIFDEVPYTPSNFARLRREVAFLRQAIGEVVREVDAVVNGEPCDTEKLEGAWVRLLELDRQTEAIQKPWVEAERTA